MSQDQGIHDSKRSKKAEIDTQIHKHIYLQNTHTNECTCAQSSQYTTLKYTEYPIDKQDSGSKIIWFTKFHKLSSFIQR
jgi:hypothetical protein